MKYKLLKEIPATYKVGDIDEFKAWEPEKFPDFFEPVGWPKRWEDLVIIEGFYNDSDSRIFNNNSYALDSHKNTFATKKQAESALAFAQLSQIAKAINEDWEPDWSDSNKKKFVIDRIQYDLSIKEYRRNYYHIAFQTREAAQFSLLHHRELWEKYWML